MTKLRYSLVSMAMVACLAIQSVGWQKQDTVYQKNGELISETTIEGNPGSSLKIRMSPSSVWVLYYSSTGKNEGSAQAVPSISVEPRQSGPPRNDVAGENRSAGREKQAVVYQKDGEIISGTIIEDTPGSTMRIKVGPHAVWLLYYHNIEKIERAAKGG